MKRKAYTLEYSEGINACLKETNNIICDLERQIFLKELEIQILKAKLKGEK